MIGFSILAIIHFYWAFGGQWAVKNALPQSISGELVMKPRPIDSAFVAVGLLLFGVFYFVKSDIGPSLQLSNWIVVVGSWMIPIIFLLRSIGDFKYVGFFKSITTTAFARWDTFFYSPLCLLIAIIGFILFIDR